MANKVEDLAAGAVDGLASQVRGNVILPRHGTYEQARKVYNAMIDRRPGMIIKCCDVADVIAAVKFASRQGLLTAVRGGGHNGAGLGVCDDGMVIDLSGIRYVHVDQATHMVRVGGGTTLGEIDHATHVFGLAVPAGIISTTGIGGLALGGGIGYLSRKYGLTIDNLIEAEIVLADGNVMVANEERNADLFWAIRGGGGNFGIVTSFKFQAHPVREVFGGVTLWPVEMTAEIMEWYDDFIQTSPNELNGFIAVLTVPGPPFPAPLHNKQFCGIVWCYAGDLVNADELFSPVRAKCPVFEHVGPMPYPAIQRMFDGLFPPGLQWYWRADFFDSLGPQARQVHEEFGKRIPTPLSQMHLYPISGAVGNIAKDATPWAYRHAKYAGVILGVDPDPANAAKLTAWCKSYWEALHPYSCGGAYVNFMMSEGPERVRSSYGSNYDRLAQIKRKYDPTNLFRVNQNILPATETAAVSG
ncbi:MAG TPA: FAD-binding oxidoreductase [Puia sp.]|nr:FAD-binding oxidoreductase [Puia sp.]